VYDHSPKLVVVIEFEPSRTGEPRLSLAQQTNEVFGPFSNEDEADAWIARRQEIVQDREFYITDVSNPIFS